MSFANALLNIFAQHSTIFDHICTCKFAKDIAHFWEWQTRSNPEVNLFNGLCTEHRSHCWSSDEWRSENYSTAVTTKNNTHKKLGKWFNKYLESFTSVHITQIKHKDATKGSSQWWCWRTIFGFLKNYSEKGSLKNCSGWDEHWARHHFSQ